MLKEMLVGTNGVVGVGVVGVVLAVKGLPPQPDKTPEIPKAKIHVRITARIIDRPISSQLWKQCP